MRYRFWLLAGLALIGVVLFAVWWFEPSVFADAQRLLDRDRLRALVERAGIWGPFLIVGFMMLAVVVSPIPSAPIAMVAGAAYGDFWGTTQVIIGAELGAIIAFWIARILGHDVLRRLFGDKVDAGLLGSQNALTWTVFASRLMPFVSFDFISYAAGLSCLKFWRFALATLAGVVPVSFLLAHLGGEAVSGNMEQATWLALGLGLVTGVPLLWIAIRKRSK